MTIELNIDEIGFYANFIEYKVKSDEERFAAALLNDYVSGEFAIELTNFIFSNCDKPQPPQKSIEKTSFLGVFKKLFKKEK